MCQFRAAMNPLVHGKSELSEADLQQRLKRPRTDSTGLMSDSNAMQSSMAPIEPPAASDQVIQLSQPLWIVFNFHVSTGSSHVGQIMANITTFGTSSGCQRETSGGELFDVSLIS